MGVVHDQVFVEEADGLLVGRGGEADEERIEVFEHLPPDVVDGAVAFVDDDDVEGLDGNGRVVDEREGLLEESSSPDTEPSSSSSEAPSP